MTRAYAAVNTHIHSTKDKIEAPLSTRSKSSGALLSAHASSQTIPRRPDTTHRPATQRPDTQRVKFIASRARAALPISSHARGKPYAGSRPRATARACAGDNNGAPLAVRGCAGGQGRRGRSNGGSHGRRTCLPSRQHASEWAQSRRMRPMARARDPTVCIATAAASNALHNTICSERSTPGWRSRSYSDSKDFAIPKPESVEREQQSASVPMHASLHMSGGLLNKETDAGSAA